MNKLNRINSILIEIIQSSTFHGLPNIFSTNRKFIRIAWILSLTTSICLNVFFIYNQVSSYYEYDIVTKIDEIYEEESELPAVSICIDHGFRKPIEKMIVTCSTNQNSTCQKRPEEFFSTWKSQWLNECYTFNGNVNMNNTPIDSVKIKRSGIANGLLLTLKLDKTNQEPFIYVLIHNSSKVGQEIKNKGFRLAPDTANYLSVEKLLITKLETPYNDCIKDPNTFDRNKTIIDLFKNSIEKYNREACLEMCFEIYYLENNNCGCVSTFRDLNRDCDNYMKNETYRTCREGFKKKFLNSDVDKYCSKFCPIECDFYYLTIRSWSSPRSINEIESYENNKNESYFSFNVYFERLGYTSISQSAKTNIQDLIANIGGTLGLFIGISFLSLIEIVEIIIQALILVFEPYKVHQING